MSKKQQNSLSRREFLKRTAALGVGLPTLGGILAACVAQPPAQPQAATGGESQAAPAAEPVSVEFWDMVWGPPEYIDSGEAIVDQFNQEQSDLKVWYQSTPWSNWYQTFLTAIGSGTAPDISTGAGYQAVQFYSQGAILEIDDVIADLKSSGKDKEFFPGALERLQYEVVTVALPWAIDIRVTIYRKSMFEAAGVQEPTTWEEAREVTKALSTGDQYGWVTSAAETGGPHLTTFVMFNNGGGLFAEDGTLDVMNESNVEAMQFVADMVADGSMHPGSAGFKNDDSRKSFGTGNTGILLDGPGSPNRFPEVKEDIGLLAPMAGLHGDTGTISWVNNVMIYKQSQNPDAAKAFLNWWSENQKPL